MGGIAVTEGFNMPVDDYGNQTDPADRGEWPDWEISDQTAWQLARYVNPEATEVPLGAHLRGHWEIVGDAGTRGKAARAEELYRLLFERDIQYSRDPWNPVRFREDRKSWKQRVRTPAEVLQGVGSCLDLSLLFAGMAMAAGIRPLIALTLDAPTPHALVVLDLVNPLGMDPAKREEGPEYWQQDVNGHGIWRPETAGDEPAHRRAPWWELNSSHWLVVDISLVCRSGVKPPQGFKAACLPELPWAADGADFTWTLLDVEAALEGQARYVPPTKRARYPIHSYLPELSGFRDYPTRRGLVRELGQVVTGGKPGRLALQGPGGRGKSLLAQRLAWSADNGCGWFLNAADAATLRASLAAAEQAERGQQPEEGANAEQLGPAEIQQLAFAALARLSNATVPWVVVLDNCDEHPSDAALRALIPQPHLPGQVVILTTREESWATAAGGWAYKPVPALGLDDLRELGLPEELSDTAADPLVAEPLAALLKRGTSLPVSGQPDSRALTWMLVRNAVGHESVAARLAELLAWLPPEPVDVDTAPVGTDLGSRRDAAEQLVRLRFLAPVSGHGERPAPGEMREVRSQGHSESVGVQQPRLVQLHRMFADTIRVEQRALGNAAVLKVLTEVLTSVWGRQAFITAADSRVLAKLEDTELEQAAEAAPNSKTTGLAWHGLGHIRERRGPVNKSGPAFEKALTSLESNANPYEVAEAQIGLARIVYQAKDFDQKKLRAAQASIEPVGVLLATVKGKDAQQMAEQGNALYWLIERKIAGREKDPARKLGWLALVGAKLRQSYEQRLRIIRGGDADVSRETAPRLEDGIGPERAYFNLAGLNVSLAKARFDDATASWWPTASPERRAALLDEVSNDLDVASKVYREVADLRERRYLGSPHPHHAACIHGNGIVAYHQAVLLHRPDYLVEAVRWVQAGLLERWQVATFTPGLKEDRIVADNDVRKSLDLLMKISVAGAMSAQGATGQQVGNALGVVSEAMAELVNWNGYHELAARG